MKLIKNLLKLSISIVVYGLVLSLQTSAQTPTKKEYKFESVSKGIVGEYGNTEVFQTADGQILIEGTGLRKTKKAAKTEFRDKIKQAVKVIDGSKENEQNSRRAVLDLGDRVKRRYLIVEYDGNRNIKYIAAENLTIALEFEKWGKSE